MSKVALKPLDTRSRTIISVSLFVVVFTILITLASIFDFQVSQILTKNALKPGEYISNDLFGFVGEALGTSPIYIVLGVCTSLLCWFFAKSFDKKGWSIALAVLFALAGAVAWWYYVKDVFKYVLEHAAAQIGAAAGSVVYEFRHDGAVMAIEWLIALTLDALTVLVFKNLKKETLKKLLWWVIAALAAAVVANIVIMIVKDPIGRMRFRAINSSVGQALIADGKVQGYTPWYIRNGQPPKDIIAMFVANYPGASDAFKSFPSGHTCAAGMSYALIMLPDVVEFKHKKFGKIACWVAPIVITMLVAISRIVVGAHYMSDVTFGGTIAFLCFVIAREIFICKGSHFFALFPKLAPKKKAAVADGQNVDIEPENATETVAEDFYVDIEPEDATETVSEDFSEQLVEESVEQTACQASQEKSDELKEEDALSGEQADEVSREIAENLRDGSIIE